MTTTSPPTAPWQMWVLLAHDPDTGCATASVGVAGTDGHTTAVSWLPLTYSARAAWTHYLAGVDDPAELTAIVAGTNGITRGVLEVDPPPAIDLRGAVEAAVDDLLVGGITGG